MSCNMEALVLPALPACVGGDSYRLRAGSDFWRLFLDNGENRELAVHSAAQKPPVIRAEGEEQVLTYDGLVAEDGSHHDIRLEVHISLRGDRKAYRAVVENGTCDTRVNEVQLPFFEFDRMNSAPEEEVLYMPCSLGERIPDPRGYVAKNFHSEYMAADNKGCWMIKDYGGSMTMSFMGVQSGDTFFNIVRKDPEFSICTFCVGCGPRGGNSMLRLTVAHYPLVRPGERVTTPEVEAMVYQGDWRLAAADYKEWTKTWLPAPEKPEWVQNMTGWQRIIMKHQYGEIFLRYEDLPRVWKEGQKYGITTILLFGWWKGRFDNGYPVYEADEAMGGAEGLRSAIRQINDMGGKVILYTNGRLIDRKSDYFRQHGKDVCQVDIDGHFYHERYQFANEGTMLRRYGYVSFAPACHATDLWAKHMTDVTKVKLDLGSNGVFFDQIGGAITNICFEPGHKHGNRGAVEAPWRMENFRNVEAMLGEDQALGTENVCDMYVNRVHFVHGGAGGCWRTPTQYPYMFRSIFPHVILSNRLLHDDREDMRLHLNNAFVYGLVFDSSIYRCRGVGMEESPRYSRYIKYLIDKKEQYARFFYHGTFVSEEDFDLPEGVFAAEYRHGDQRMFAFMNDKDEKITFSFKGETVTIGAQDVECLVLPQAK